MASIKKIKPLRYPVSVTANLLLKGLTVYLKADGSWSADVTDSAVAHDLAQLTALLALASISEKSQYVVGAYSFDVKPVNGKPAPMTMREIIRAKRIPTITPNGLTDKPEWENQFTKTNHASQNLSAQNSSGNNSSAKNL